MKDLDRCRRESRRFHLVPKFRALKADYRPALVADDVNGLTLKGVTYTEPSPWKEQEVFNNVERLVKE